VDTSLVSASAWRAYSLHASCFYIIVTPIVDANLPFDQILLGDCIEVLSSLPEKSIDLVFADPPYNLQLQGDLWRPNLTRVDAVTDDWDKFTDLQAYDTFSKAWLLACRRVLKDTGTIWVIGTYHNIFRLGNLMQDLGFWFLNDVIWIKTNPMPNFRGVRFTNAHETLIWASKSKGQRYTFNHYAMKSMNDGLQMRSDWYLPICSGAERIRVNGKKAHSTQKPEALLYRIILASSNPGEVVLDPFFGSGTTGVVAKNLHRHWIGIERDPDNVDLGRARIDTVIPAPYDPVVFDTRSVKQRQGRLPFSRLLEEGCLTPGQALFFHGDRDRHARVKPDGTLIFDEIEGSIHQVGRYLLNGSPCNGWETWYYETESGELRLIDELRREILSRGAPEEPEP